MHTKKVLLYGLTALAVAGALTGCSGNAKEEKEHAPANGWKMTSDPLTLNMYQLYAALTDAEFQELIVKPIKAKYPNITINLIRGGSAGNLPDQMVATGSFPDIILTDMNSKLRELAVFEDLSGLAAKHGTDLNRYKSSALDTIRITNDGKLTSLPFAINFYALFYNKDIFDKFGASYPKDSMTWDDSMELARKVTRLDGGVQYRGFNPGNPSLLGSQLSLPLIDKKTDKPLLESDGWNKVYGTLKQIYEIPGNLTDIKQYGGSVRDRFMKDRLDAMVHTFGMGMVSGFEEQRAAGSPLNWDMVTSPTFKEAPNTSPGLNLHVLGVSNTSKHKDEAFAVISELLTDANQSQAMKYGRLTGLNNAELKKDFGTNLESLKGKNVEALFKLDAPKPIETSKYNDATANTLNTTFIDVLQGNADINTALKKAQQVAEQAISQDKAK